MDGCMMSMTNPSADSFRLEVQLHWRLCRRSWSVSHWWEAYDSQLGAVFMGVHWWRGSCRRASSWKPDCADCL